ncbi:PaaI family thioesterase [Nocardioides dubius]|uniref:Acyl-coenzyme A thioesterase THEM4 n=1 Tax=Nocardioides dubius TaxID=317019 RepID=A0ABN1U263_9ACTN
MSNEQRPVWHKRVTEAISADELAEREALWVPLTEEVRELVSTAILSEVDEHAVALARQHIRAAQEILGTKVDTGSFGMHVNDEGLAWNWGNAATGQKNAVAPPLCQVPIADGVRYEADFGAGYEGPPGCLHGGWIALILDHASGRAAHLEGNGPTFTGTLTIRYLQPTRLGPAVAHAWVETRTANKFVVRCTLSTEDGVTAESEGVFVLARWARKPQED